MIYFAKDDKQSERIKELEQYVKQLEDSVETYRLSHQTWNEELTMLRAFYNTFKDAV